VETTHPVGLADLLPTLAEIAGAEIPATISGQSLMPILREEHVPDRVLFGLVGTHFCAFDGRYRYMWEGESGEELMFDHLEDYKDELDLAGMREHRETKQRLRGALTGWLGKNKDLHVENGELVTVPVRTIGEKGALGFDNSPWNNRGWRG
jgi:hypothetical protein